MTAKLVLRCAAGALGATLCTFACGTESASTHAALGFTDSLHGAIYPEGFYVRTDILAYRSSRLNDQHGNPATANFGPSLAAFGVPAGTPGTSGAVRLNADGFYGQLTLFNQLHVSNKVLGIDSVGFGATFLYGSLNVDLDAQIPVLAAFGQPTLRDLGSGDVSSLGDTAIFPLYLGWWLYRNPDKTKFEQWSFTANPLNIYVKTGTYDANRTQNIGRNYNSWAPQIATTYQRDGLELSALLNYLKNGRNSATDYKSGDELFLSFAVLQTIPLGALNAQPPPAFLKIGLSGYYYKQLTDDKRGGVSVYSSQDSQPDIFNNGVGNRGQSVAIGPSIEYLSADGRWAINFHWDHEFQSRNLPQADRYWVKVAYRFDALGR